MAFENNDQAPIAEDEIEAIVDSFIVPDSPRQLVRESNVERHELLDNIYELLDGLPYRYSETNPGGRQAFHRLWRESDNDNQWERSILIAHMSYDNTQDRSWHVIINDGAMIDGRRVLTYAEYVLPVFRHLMGFRYVEADIPSGESWNREKVSGMALLVKRHDKFEVIRGDGSKLLAPPRNWHIRDAAERYVVYNELAYLQKSLRELSPVTFEEHITGVVC